MTQYLYRCYKCGMPHLARKFQLVGSLFYHVFNRGNARREIFHAPEDYARFKKTLGRYAETFGMRVFHWALMPNHYHLLVQLDEPQKLSAIMAGIARSYVYYHHAAYDSAGHLWQGRFKSQPIEKDTYLLACGRYIERNPVQAGIVSSAEEYPHSSARYYTLARPDGLTEKDPLYSSFGATHALRRQQYKEFLAQTDIEQDRFFETLESPMGSKEFVRRLAQKRGLYLPKVGRPTK